MTVRSLIKKSEGVISLFMAIVMLATFVMSGVIVEGSRLRQAEAIIQSAADSAAMSVLAKYDIDLYDRYGLFVMDSQSKEDIQQDYINFFMANLSASLPDEDTLSSLFTRLETKYGLKKGIEDLFDMYDFQADDIDVTPVYSIGAPQILQLQTTEVSKYRSAFLLLQDLTGKGEKIAEASQQQDKDVEVMQQSLTYRDEASDITNKLVQFTEELYQFYDGGEEQGANKGKKLRADYGNHLSDIDTVFSSLRTAYNNASNGYGNIKSAVNEYNQAVDDIATAEEQLMLDKENIVFDPSAEDYDSEAVEQWNKRAEDIDKDVSDLKNNKLNDVNIAINNYNTYVGDVIGYNDALKEKITNMENYLGGLKTTLEGFLSRYNNELEGEIKDAIQSTNDHKSYLTSSGGSNEVVASAEDDANIVLESLQNALDAKIPDKLNATITYVDGLISKLNTFKATYGSLSFTLPEVTGINYIDTDGTVEALQIKADNINASKAPEEEDVRPDWQSLSEIEEPAGNVSVDPANAFTNYQTAFAAIQKPDGNDPFPRNSEEVDYYMYSAGTDGSLDFGDSEAQKTGVVQTLTNLYNNNTTNSESTLTGEPNGDISDMMSSLPSHNRNKFSLTDTFASDDATYVTEFEERYRGASVVDVGDASGLSGDSTQELEGLSGFTLGNDASSQSRSFDILGSFMESVSNFFTSKQYDIMTYVYTMSMFKNRLTKAPSDWAELYNNQTESPREKEYYVKRDTEDADLNLMFDHLTSDDLATKLNCELEYILRGDSTDKQNRDEVWSIIYGLRLGNNLIAVYSNSDLRHAAASTAQAIAAAIAAVTFGAGSVLAPIIQFAIIAIIAALETYWDMVFLVNMGYKVPFIKTTKNLNISLDNLEDGDVSAPNFESSDLMVKYEDYLLIFMLFTNQEDVLFRTADLIQMNMALETGESDYNLSKRFTYLRYESKVSIKPLMISYAFMPDDIRRDDRRLFTTLAYQGY